MPDPPPPIAQLEAAAMPRRRQLGLVPPGPSRRGHRARFDATGCRAAGGDAACERGERERQQEMANQDR